MRGGRHLGPPAQLRPRILARAGEARPLRRAARRSTSVAEVLRRSRGEEAQGEEERKVRRWGERWEGCKVSN